MAEARLSLLMAAYQNGELAAFDNLYRQLQPSLRRYLLALTRDVELAEDLVQETFLQIHRSRHTYDPLRPAGAWAFGIARYVFLMDRRASRRRQETQAEEWLPELVAPALFSFAERGSLRQAIAGLPPDRREPLLLHHVFGFSFKEIGGILGIREGAAKVRAHRAMLQLREVLGIET